MFVGEREGGRFLEEDVLKKGNELRNVWTLEETTKNFGDCSNRRRSKDFRLDREYSDLDYWWIRGSVKMASKREIEGRWAPDWLW